MEMYTNVQTFKTSQSRKKQNKYCEAEKNLYWQLWHIVVFCNSITAKMIFALFYKYATDAFDREQTLYAAKLIFGEFLGDQVVHLTFIVQAWSTLHRACTHLHTRGLTSSCPSVRQHMSSKLSRSSPINTVKSLFAWMYQTTTFFSTTMQH